MVNLFELLSYTVIEVSTQKAFLSLPNRHTHTHILICDSYSLVTFSKTKLQQMMLSFYR